jgi:hypothetical protein
MLAVITQQMLVKVDDEEEAASLAMKIDQAVIDAIPRLVAEAAIRNAIEVHEYQEALDDNFATLGTQVTMLPGRVTD